MISDYWDDSLKMIDLTSFNKALESIWIKKYLDTENQANGNSSFTLSYNSLVALLF